MRGGGKGNRCGRESGRRAATCASYFAAVWRVSMYRLGLRTVGLRVTFCAVLHLADVEKPLLVGIGAMSTSLPFAPATAGLVWLFQAMFLAQRGFSACQNERKARALVPWCTFPRKSSQILAALAVRETTSDEQPAERRVRCLCAPCLPNRR